MPLTSIDAKLLATGLTQPEALTLLSALAEHHGWTYCVWTLDDVESRLERRLTDDEKREVVSSRWWSEVMGDIAYEYATDSIWDMIRELGIRDAELLDAAGVPYRPLEA